MFVSSEESARENFAVITKMVMMFAPNEAIDTSRLLSQLRGKYAAMCLNRIEKQNGRIIAIDFTTGQWPDGHGESIFYSIGPTDDQGHCLLATDNCQASFMALGGRYPQDRQLAVVQFIAEHDGRLAALRQAVQDAACKSTNLVGVAG